MNDGLLLAIALAVPFLCLGLLLLLARLEDTLLNAEEPSAQSLSGAGSSTPAPARSGGTTKR